MVHIVACSVVTAVLAVLCAGWWATQTNNTETTSSTGYRLQGEVQRRQWTPDKPFAQEVNIALIYTNSMQIAATRQPMVLMGTVVDLWKARTAWTPDYFAELEQVTCHTKRIKPH